MTKTIQYDTAQATRTCCWCDQIVAPDGDQVVIGHLNNYNSHTLLHSAYNCWLQVFHARCYNENIRNK